MAIDYYRKVQAFEREIVSEALHEARGNQAQAARRLGLAPTPLSSQLRRLGIQVRDFKRSSPSTVSSGEGSPGSSQVLPDQILSPGGFVQVSGILASNGF